AFNETNEYGITVELAENGMSYNDLREQMNAAIISGELPNLVAGYQSDALSYYLDDGALDLTPLLNDATFGYSEDELASLNMGIIQLNVFEEEGGVMLGWPNHVSASLQAVNLDMLAELGFAGAPETYEDFMAISCAAAELENVGGYPLTTSPNEFENFVAARGGVLFADGKWDFTSEAAVAALQMYADLYSQGCAYIPEDQYGNTADFSDLLNPMAQTSTAGIPYILGDMQTNKDESGVEIPNWTIATVPWTDDNRMAQIYVQDIIVVPATPEEEVASWLFLKFLTLAENQIAWTQATSYFPINLDAAANLADFEAANPYFAAAKAIVADPNIKVYGSPQVISYNAVRGIMSEGIADVTSNGRDVMDVAQEMTDKANEAHADLQ
ncbi:MAG: extracellular solute-binding protein, partial [Anaerolineae bacterium]|nr:extracellular solute-binding protein [Anaerolineae bacterium]